MERDAPNKTSKSVRSQYQQTHPTLPEEYLFNRWYLNLSKEKIIEVNRAIILGLLRNIKDLERENEMLKRKISA